MVDWIEIRQNEIRHSNREKESHVCGDRLVPKEKKDGFEFPWRILQFWDKGLRVGGPGTVRVALLAPGMSSVRYGIRLGDLKNKRPTPSESFDSGIEIESHNRMDYLKINVSHSSA